MTYRIGVDLGGTKISVAVLNGNNATVFAERMNTPASNYQDILNTIHALVRKTTDHIGKSASVPRIGIGIPGALHCDGITVKNANTQVLIGKPLKQDLENKLGKGVILANDATCFAASEAADGAAAGADVVFGVILGTGVGGGVVVNGKPWGGVNSLAGEWGHNPFPFYGAHPKGRKCYCGKTDCIETILSGPSIALDYLELTNRKAAAKKIAQLAIEGEDAAQRVLDQFYRNLAKALSTVINMLDPAVIVLGGGLSNIADIYERTPRLWGEYVFNATPEPAIISTRLVQNQWGDDSGVRGAAWLT